MITAEEREIFGRILNKLGDEIFDGMAANGFHDKPLNDGESIALMHSELSEALEALRHGDPLDAHCPEYKNSLVEMCDTLIRIVHWTKRHGVNNLGDILFAKHDYNKTRPYKHGKKF